MNGFKFSLLALAVAAATFSMNANAGGVSDIKPIGRYTHGANVTLKSSGKIDTIAGKAEIVAYDKTTKRLFVVNAVDGAIDVLNITNPTSPELVGSIDIKNSITGFYNGSPNSVAAYNGLIAVAVEAETKQNAGVIAFYDAADLSFKKSVIAGALPDMVISHPMVKKLSLPMKANLTAPIPLTRKAQSASLICQQAWTQPRSQTSDLVRLTNQR